MEHSFNVELAKLYGVDCAIFLHDLHYWVIYNEAHDQNKREGRYWTYNSRKSWTYFFPYWSVDQIRRIAKKLIDAGVIVTARLNKKNYDHTIWYSFSDKGYALMKSLNPELAISPNQGDGNPNAIPYTVLGISIEEGSNTLVSTPNETLVRTRNVDNSSITAKFNTFWKAYPRHVAKQNAIRAFSKLNPSDSLLEIILKDIEARKKTDAWSKEGGQFIPHPATYLNGRRWEDEMPKPSPLKTTGRKKAISETRRIRNDFTGIWQIKSKRVEIQLIWMSMSSLSEKEKKRQGKLSWIFTGILVNILQKDCRILISTIFISTIIPLRDSWRSQNIFIQKGRLQRFRSILTSMQEP